MLHLRRCLILLAVVLHGLVLQPILAAGDDDIPHAVFVVVFRGATWTQRLYAGQTGSEGGSIVTDFALETL